MADLGMFVGRIIIDDGVDHFASRNLLFGGIGEANELLVAVAQSGRGAGRERGVVRVVVEVVMHVAWGSW